MKIALIGYGKMGKAIEAIAIQKGHDIVVKIDLDNAADFNKENLAKAEVAIEFTGPASAFENIKKCLLFGIPVVSGSTGWLNNWQDITAICEQQDGAFIYASNFSIGVNLFFELTSQLARLMAPHKDYAVSIEEIHHTQKKDAPSGTAITLAEAIIAQSPDKNGWVNQPSQQSEDIPIISKRIDPAPGTHKITYHSLVDDIEIIHTAHNRTGFAGGAVLAAEFILNKKGVFNMKQVLGL